MIKALRKPHNLIKRASSKQGHKQAGFSLIEVMIALGIFSLVLGLLYSGFWTSSRLLLRSNDQQLELGEQLLLQRLFTQWVSNITISTQANASSKRPFFGGPQKMRFFSTNVDHKGATALYEFGLSIEEDQENGFGTSRLAISQKLVPPSFVRSNTPPETRTSTISVGSRISRFSYQNQEFQSEWIDTWPYEDRLPAAIRIEMTDKTMIIASPAIKLDAECVSQRGLEGLAGRFCGTGL